MTASPAPTPSPSTDWTLPEEERIRQSMLRRLQLLRRCNDDIKLQAKCIAHLRNSVVDFVSDWCWTYDPRNLIREAYRIKGIAAEDCRSIFFDWALGLKDGQDSVEAAQALLAHYAGEPEEHPMTGLLREAAERRASVRRRGGGAAGRR